jgi:hypothetical protein
VTRQPDFSTTRRAGPASAWARLALLACALAPLFTAAQAFRAREEARAASERLAEVNRDVVAVTARRRALEGRDRLAGGTLLPAEDAPPARIVADVARVLPGPVRLERLSIDYSRGGALEMLVVARDAAAWDLLLERLEAAGSLREVEPGPEARDAEIRSVVRARWTGGAP